MRLPALLIAAVGVAGFTLRITVDQQQELDAYRRVLMDWGGLTYYGSEDAELNLKPGRARVVFLGDEIFEEWGKGKAPFFPGKPYVNRGITRQTSAQMLVRFRQDVIELHPEIVVIEAGSNDIAGTMGPASEATIADHIKSMVELAQVHKIRVVLASVLPVCDCFEKLTARRSPVRIMGLNGWLKGYAKESGVNLPGLLLRFSEWPEYEAGIHRRWTFA